MKRVHSTRLRGLLVCLVLFLGSKGGHGQGIIAIGDPSFQAWPSRSLESDILTRLSMGQYQPDDLPRLARLTILESIAMLQSIRADDPASPVGRQLEGEIGALWDAADVFYENLGAPPDDLAAFARSQEQLSDVGTAFRQVESLLGNLPGLSGRAAAHLRDISRLLAATNSVMDAAQRDLIRPAPAARAQPSERELLQNQVRLVIEDLANLIRQTDEVRRGQSGRDAVIEDLRRLLELVRGFDRVVSVATQTREVAESFRPASRLMNRLDSSMGGRNWPPAIRQQWRVRRERMKTITDDLGRAKGNSPAAPARPPAPVNRGLVAQIDRTVLALDELLSARRERLRKADEGMRFQDDVRQLRLSLLLLRQRALANESTDRLSQSLRDIEARYRQLGDPVRPGVSVIRGVSGQDASRPPGPSGETNKPRQVAPDR
jgi:hypothetical protein